jgi:hypothetical protein
VNICVSVCATYVEVITYGFSCNIFHLQTIFRKVFVFKEKRKVKLEGKGDQRRMNSAEV